MAGYIQRFPFAPKATWWKRYPDTALEIIGIDPSNIIKYENNTYLRKFAFDCIKDSDQQNASNKIMQGTTADSTHLTLKTYFFCEALDEPKHEDLLYYQGEFWMVEATNKKYYYVPKEKSVLYLTISKVVKNGNEKLFK